MKLFKIVTVFMVLLSTLKGYSQSEGYGTEYSHYKAKGAFEGIWLYENSSKNLKFEIRLKCVYRLTTTGDTLTKVLGTYSFYKKGKKMKMNSLLKKYIDRDNYDSLFLSISSFSDYEQLSNEHIYGFPISGYLSEEDNDFNLYDVLTKNATKNARYFRVDVQQLDASNTILIWDIWKESTYSECRIITGKEPKPGDFTIPEKCTLTRVSHDPMYGL